VDVERIRPLDELVLARRWFAPAEVAALEALSGEERRAEFFACWTRKEAYVKALGSGLTTPLSSFEVPVPGWTFTDLALPAGYRGAAAAEGDDWELVELAVSTPSASP